MSLLLTTLGVVRADELDPFRIRFDDVAPAPRVIAIGDLHGDLRAAQKTLELAGAVDPRGNWVGRNLIVVQMGDIIDRGDFDLDLLNFLNRLESEAKEFQSLLILLNGNHEYLNLQHRFDYASQKSTAQFVHEFSWTLNYLLQLPEFRTPAPVLAAVGTSGPPWGFYANSLLDWEFDFEESPPLQSQGETIFQHYEKSNHPGLAARATAFSPQSAYFEQLARRSYFAIVGDTVFVHGGILPKALDYGLLRLQTEINKWLNPGIPLSAWLLTHHTKQAPLFLNEADSPLWSRQYGQLPADPISFAEMTADYLDACSDLQIVLERLAVKRMVVAHTIQPEREITSACSGRVWRTDIGMSHGFSEPSPEYQILTIQKDEIEVLIRRKTST